LYGVWVDGAVQLKRAQVNWSALPLRFANVLLAALSFANLMLGTLFALAGELTIGWTCLTAGLVLFLVATIDRFASIKGLGVEARTRELSQKLEHADRVLANLRSLSKLTAASLIDVLSGAGRWDSAPSARQLFEYTQRFRALLESQAIPRSEVDDALRPWVRITAFDMAQHAMSNLRAVLQAKQTSLSADLGNLSKSGETGSADQTLEARLKSVRSFNDRLIGEESWQTRDKSAWCKTMLQSAPELSDAERAAAIAWAEPWIDELDHLARAGALANPERWFSVDQHAKA
jgi:hypothetical protein